jgi:hypothetical protein
VPAAGDRNPGSGARDSLPKSRPPDDLDEDIGIGRVRGIFRHDQLMRLFLVVALDAWFLQVPIALILLEKTHPVLQALRIRRVHAKFVINPDHFPIDDFADVVSLFRTGPTWIGLDVEDVVRPRQAFLAPSRFLDGLRNDQFPRAACLVRVHQRRTIQACRELDLVFIGVCHHSSPAVPEYR